MTTPNWQSLLSSYRIGQAAVDEPSVRSTYQRDGDRLIFSAAFRRLQDKTQVFPLAQNDYVRTRLTHSLEVACVGRSLGTAVGNQLLTRYPELTQCHQAADVGDIVWAACLAHDIGNPPFGHFGEQAMRDYFTSPAAKSLIEAIDNPIHIADLCQIEGNAQGFRIVNRLESPETVGGLRLTAATLASASKYPALAYGQKAYQKNGCYDDDWQDFCQIFKQLGLRRINDYAWQRHPLSYLMEAADDICYLIIDIEDAYQVGQISHQIAKEKLMDLAGELVEPLRLSALNSKTDQLAYLRAKAIGQLVHETSAVFWQHEQALLAGTHHRPLLKDIPSSAALEALRAYAKTHIYMARSVLETQIAGHKILTGLMEVFCQSVLSAKTSANLSRRDEMILALLPSRYLRHNQSLYQQILGVCDYITGMTDSYAVSLYKKLTGISLPVN